MNRLPLFLLLGQLSLGADFGAMHRFAAQRAAMNSRNGSAHSGVARIKRAARKRRNQIRAKRRAS